VTAAAARPRRAAPLGGFRAVAAVVAAAAFPGALYGLPLLGVSANRLAIGEPVLAGTGFGPAILLAAALGAGASLLLGLSRRRRFAACAAGLAALGLLLLLAGLGQGAANVLASRPPAARAALALGAWLALGGTGAVLALALRRAATPVPGLAALAVLASAIAATGAAGLLDALSLAVEFRTRREGLLGALGEHLALSCGAVALAAILVVALRLFRGARGAADLLASGIQVVPAVALLGALVALFSGLLKAAPGLREAGLSALGTAPALIAVAAYLMLPLQRGLDAAWRAPDRDTLDAARGLGLSPGQIVLRVRLPVGAPALIGGLRVACVQAIGLATLGALVGAGGLGRLVFDGMAQFAPDLILLGAIPIVALSLLAEMLLSALAGSLQP